MAFLASRQVWYVVAAAVVADLVIVAFLSLSVEDVPDPAAAIERTAPSALPAPVPGGPRLAPLGSGAPSGVETAPSPSPTPAASAPAARLKFPSSGARLGETNDVPPWESWSSPQDGVTSNHRMSSQGMLPGVRESTANTPARLGPAAQFMPAAQPLSPPAGDSEAYYSARRDAQRVEIQPGQTRRSDTPAGTSTAPKLMGTIRPLTPQVDHERPRSSLY